MKKIIFTAIVILNIFLTDAYSQQTGSTPQLNNDESVYSVLDLSNEGKKTMRNVVLIGSIPTTFLVASRIWEWNKGVNFHYNNEGWFGVNTEYAGQDKMCHFYAHYVMQRGFINLFDYTENGSKIKYLYATGLTSSIGLFIELGDSISSVYGFGVQDLFMDMAGILAGTILEYYPTVGAFVGFSAEYIPTKAWKNNMKNSNDSYLSFINDYSGWKFMANFKLAGFRQIGYNLPDVLRYVQFDFGYYTKGYTNFDENYSNKVKRTRNIFIGVSLNSAEAVRSFFPGGGPASKVASVPLEYYHLPIGYRSVVNSQNSSKASRHE